MKVLQYHHPRLRKSNAGGTYEHTPDLTLNPPTVEFTCAERPIYGSSRVGMLDSYGRLPEQKLRDVNPVRNETAVLVIVSDVKVIVQDGGVITGYAAQVISATDHSPFGVALEGRTYSGECYRYGFNGQEWESEITGDDTHTSVEFWMNDTRLGRTWEIDPVKRQFLSNYSTRNDSPIGCFNRQGDSPESCGTNVRNTEQCWCRCTSLSHGYKWCMDEHNINSSLKNQ